MSDPDSPSNHDPIPDPSSSSPLHHSSPPPSLPLLPPPAPDATDLSTASVPASSKTNRRLPPPCWSLEETIALIDGYKEKWLALNRGNLKANHWEEVAEFVAVNCPDVTPKKTAVQCRHKMEKLRKRYRTEIQRARSVPVARFISSWVHFKRMEAMENQKPGPEIEEDDEEFVPRTTPRFFNRNGSSGGGGGGIRIRIPTGVSLAQPGPPPPPRFPGKIDPKYTTNPNPKPRLGKRGREAEAEAEDDDSGGPIASAIRLLGDTLLRTEQSKMEMAREIEAMRMEMEMKRTKMILDSQQRLVETFAKTLSEKKNNKI